MSDVADPLSAAFAAVSRTEAALRDAIRTDLSRVDGPRWMTRIPEELRVEWQKRQQADEANGISRGPEPIEYATVADVVAVVRREPDIFSARFGEPSQAITELEQLRLLRNSVMRNGAAFWAGVRQSNPRCPSSIGKVPGRSVLCACSPAPCQCGGPVRKAPSTEEQKRVYDVIAVALAKMSGRLTGERNAVVSFLRNNLVACSSDALAAFQAKFGGLPGTQQVIEALYRELPPARPTPPPMSSRKPADWLKWADTHYLPCRRWLIRTGRGDSEVAEWALAFEDWLARAYPGMLQGGGIDSMVVTAYRPVEQQLKDGARTIWLTVDNLASLWRWEFQSALREAGFTVLKAQRVFALLQAQPTFRGEQCWPDACHLI